VQGQGGLSCIAVLPFTESMGRVEDALPALVARLHDGGRLVLEVENCQSLRRLRMALEGRPGNLEPLDDCGDPAQALPLKRVLQAAANAGLHVSDVLRVPGWNQVGPDFAGDAFRSGFLPVAWLDGAPPARYWLSCRRQRPLAGTVLIGNGTRSQQAATAACCAAFLPQDWEIRQCDPEHGRESTAFNRALAAATGELVWFLRAGTEPSAVLFRELVATAEFGPAAPGHDGERTAPGDVSGLMLARLDVLLAGPLPERWHNDAIAFEDWLMQLDCCAAPTQVVDAGFATPAPAVAAPARFAAESARMLERWQPVTRGKPLWDATGAAPSEPRPAPWDGRQPRVSLCMIARNEERFLPACLDAVREAVDEIVLVDTGSTDRTVAIAESYGARVLHERWDDDFSAPRNVGLRACTGDWILVLDADEVVQPGGTAKIRELVQEPGASGYHLHFTNHYGKGRTLGVMMVRLFRNLPGIEYRNVIHEQVTPSLLRIGAAQGLVLCSTDLEVVHYGYADEVMDSRKKNERNERLFEKQLAQDPDDIYGRYKYGDFLRRLPGRSKDARANLERCLELILQGPPALPRELPYAGEVAALCALELLREGRHTEAQAIVTTALRHFIPTPNLHYIAASLALQQNRNDDAILHYRRCLTYRGQILVVPIQDGITGHVALGGMAQAFLQKGDLARAQQLLERAIAMEPGYEVSHLTLSRLHLVRGDVQASLRVLTDYLATHPDSAGACQQTTLLLHRIGLKQQARRMGERALHLLRAGAQDHEADHMQKILAALT